MIPRVCANSSSLGIWYSNAPAVNDPIVSTRASAPGKVLLAGEYAVLSGAEAVILAVPHRAVASHADSPRHSPLLQAVVDRMELVYGRSSAQADAARHTQVDSSALNAPCGTKLGLGSSAAVAVAAVGRALAAADTTEPAAVVALAQQAHADAQAQRGARGSGVDVICSARGGLIAATQSGSVRTLELPGGTSLVAVWTGRAADSATMVAAVQNFQDNDPATFRARIAAIAAAADDLAEACTTNDPERFVAAVATGARCADELGRAAGVDIVLPVHHQLAERARALGGSAKPTGAGGGDIAIAAFADPDAARCYSKEVANLSSLVWNLEIDPNGITLG